MQKPEVQADYPEVLREVSQHANQALGRLMLLILKYDVRFSLEYDTGRYIAGEHAYDDDGNLLPLEDLPADRIEHGPQGFRVMVANRFREDTNTGEQKLYSSLNEAVYEGLLMLFLEFTEKLGRPAAEKIFGQYFDIRFE